MREDLIKALKSHDWAYQYADQFSIWDRGRAERSRIYDMIKVAHEEGWGQEAEDLFNEYQK